MVSKFPIPQPLGKLLQEANLVSAKQIELALKEQAQSQKGKIGEILAEKGFLKQETADFFAQDWHDLRQKGDLKQPLGYYLIRAGLLNEEQINTLIEEQNQGRLWVRIGACAVLKGWLKQGTVDFFVENLFPEYAFDSPFIKPQ